LTRIAIFASGAGSNARKIINHFNNPANKTARVVLVVCNKPGAGVLKIAEEHSIPTLLIKREEFYGEDSCLPALREMKVDFLVLAGALWKVPGALITTFPRSIVNIPPARLPEFCGKGMYGNHVHSAVIAAGRTESGIT